MLFILGTSLLHQLPPLALDLWECLGGQGIVAGSASGEYQSILEYIYALIKKQNKQNTLHWKVTNLPITISILHCSFSAFFNKYLIFICDKIYSVCKWKQMILLERRIMLRVPAGDRTPELL